MEQTLTAHIFKALFVIALLTFLAYELSLLFKDDIKSIVHKAHTNIKKLFKQSYSIEDSLKKVGLPIIQVESKDGIKLTMIIDSGSNTSILNFNKLSVLLNDKDNRCELQRESNGKIESITGINGSDVTKVKGCTIEFCMHKKSMIAHFDCVNLDSLFDKMKEDLGKEVDGILGNDFLYINQIIIDYKKMKIYI